MKHPQAQYTVFPTEAGQWPPQWLFEIHAKETGEGVDVFTGRQVRRERDGSLTYWCFCGSTINRQPGEKNDEMQAWVTEHSRPMLHYDLDPAIPGADKSVEVIAKGAEDVSNK